MNKYNRALKWKCDTPALMADILNNPGTGILQKPLHIFKSILAEVADRAIQLNDPILNELMCDLRLYEIPAPNTPEYRKLMKYVRAEAAKLRKEKNINL